MSLDAHHLRFILVLKLIKGLEWPECVSAASEEMKDEDVTAWCTALQAFSHSRSGMESGANQSAHQGAAIKQEYFNHAKCFPA